MTPTAFIFKSYQFDAPSGALSLHYAYDNGIDFSEVITFPMPSKQLPPETQAVLDRLFKLLFYVCGISYYKAYAPKMIQFDHKMTPDLATAAFLQSLYTHGLSEFAYENSINIRERVNFEQTNNTEQTPIHITLSDRALVPVGGGKDSIVTIESLKSLDKDICLYSIGSPQGPADPIAKTIAASGGLSNLHVSRVICPNLIKLNKEPDVLNGHVPITAIVSVTALITAVLHDYNSVVFSNEHSASIPNIIEDDGWQVNHQYSKSYEFEAMLSSYIEDHITPELRYFSYLRPWSEIAIAKKFATCEGYHAIFRSCNTAFRQDVSKRGTHWCCDCPKCRFVFLSLAPFMEKEKLISIFGMNLLNESSQVTEFKKLCGLADYKPFECVGTTEESSLVMIKLAQMDEWKADTVVTACNVELAQCNTTDFNILFNKRSPDNIPDDYKVAIL